MQFELGYYSVNYLDPLIINPLRKDDQPLNGFKIRRIKRSSGERWRLLSEGRRRHDERIAWAWLRLV